MAHRGLRKFKKRQSKIKMDCRTRRSRRRGYSCNTPRPCPQPWSFINSLTSTFILGCLIGAIYLMLEYHCTTCNSSCDLKNINKSIEDIAVGYYFKYLLFMFNNLAHKHSSAFIYLPIFVLEKCCLHKE